MVKQKGEMNIETCFVFIYSGICLDFLRDLKVKAELLGKKCSLSDIIQNYISVLVDSFRFKTLSLNPLSSRLKSGELIRTRELLELILMDFRILNSKLKTLIVALSRSAKVAQAKSDDMKLLIENSIKVLTAMKIIKALLKVLPEVESSQDKASIQTYYVLWPILREMQSKFSSRQLDAFFAQLARWEWTQLRSSDKSSIEYITN